LDNKLFSAAESLAAAWNGGIGLGQPLIMHQLGKPVLIRTSVQWVG